MEFAGSKDYGILSNSELINCVRWESGAVRKVLFRDRNNGD